MTPDEVKKQNERDQQYWKLNSGDKLKGYFESNDFNRVEDTYDNGQKAIRYEAKFTGSRNGGETMTKLYKCSGAQVERFANAAVNVEKQFLNSVFVISRSGEGLNTEYDIQVFGDKQNPVAKAKEESGVPF